MPNTPSDRPSIAEIAAFTRRLRDLSQAGRDADPADRERFLTDKRALFDRITADRPPARGRDAAFAAAAAEDAVRDVARAQAENGGYVLVGPSARTWRADDGGRAVEPATEAEHRAVRELLGRDQLDTTEPAWTTTADGRTDIVSTVIPTADTYGAAWSDDPFADDAARDGDHAGAAPDAWDDYRTHTPDEAAAALIARGVPPDQAPGVVDRYLDSLTFERGWSPQDQWQLDDDDLVLMTSPPEDEVPRTASAWAPPAAIAATAETRASARAADAELERRAQLAGWDHADTTTATEVDDATAEPARVIELCNPIPGEEPTS